MEDASHILEENIPKLEANVKGLSAVELNVDFIIANVIEDGPHGQIGRKIIHYQSKQAAIQECINALKESDKVSVEDTIKMVRNLSGKQFKCMIKAQRLINYVQTGSKYGMQQHMYA